MVKANCNISEELEMFAVQNFWILTFFLRRERLKIRKEMSFKIGFSQAYVSGRRVWHQLKKPHFWLIFTLEVAGFNWEFWECSWIPKSCDHFYIWTEASCLFSCAGQAGNSLHCCSDLWNGSAEFCTWDQAAHELFLTAHFMSRNMQGETWASSVHVITSTRCHEICFWESRKKSVIPPQTAWEQNQGIQQHLVQQDHTLSA